MVGSNDILVHDVLLYSCECHRKGIIPYTDLNKVLYSVNMEENERNSLWRTLRYHYLFKLYRPMYRMLGCQTGHVQSKTDANCRVLSEEEYKQRKTMQITINNGTEICPNSVFHERNGFQNVMGQNAIVVTQNGIRHNSIGRGRRICVRGKRSYRNRKIHAREKFRLSCPVMIIPEEPEIEVTDFLQSAIDYDHDSDMEIEARNGEEIENYSQLRDDFDFSQHSNRVSWNKSESDELVFSDSVLQSKMFKPLLPSKSCHLLKQTDESVTRDLKRSCSFPVKNSKPKVHATEIVYNHKLSQSNCSLAEEVSKPHYSSFEALATDKTRSKLISKSSNSINTLTLNQTALKRPCKEDTQSELNVTVAQPVNEPQTYSDWVKCASKTPAISYETSILSELKNQAGFVTQKPTQHLIKGDLIKSKSCSSIRHRTRSGVHEKSNKISRLFDAKNASHDLRLQMRDQLGADIFDNQRLDMRDKNEKYEFDDRLTQSCILDHQSLNYSLGETVALQSKYLETNPLLNVKRCRSETNLKGEVIHTQYGEPIREQESDEESTDSDSDNENLVERYRKRKIRTHRKLDQLLGFKKGCCLRNDSRQNIARHKKADLYGKFRSQSCVLVGCEICTMYNKVPKRALSPIMRSKTFNVFHTPLPQNAFTEQIKKQVLLQKPAKTHPTDNNANYHLKPVQLRQKRTKITNNDAYRHSLPAGFTTTPHISPQSTNISTTSILHRNNKQGAFVSNSQSCMCFQSQQKNDRQEILRKLAMAPEEESTAVFEADKALKKSNVQSRFQHGHGLQVCFMNEQMVPAPAQVEPNSLPADNTHTSSQPENTTPKEDASTEVSGSGDLKTKQQRLQHEATIALAQVRPMAHMQLMVEKQQKKKSPLAEIVGIPGLGDEQILEISHDMLLVMNLAQLQVVVNDLHSQIENLNIDLMNQLVERDDLHMEQDSMLVDIEDLHRRAEELSLKVSSTPNTPRKKRGKKK